MLLGNAEEYVMRNVYAKFVLAVLLSGLIFAGSAFAQTDILYPAMDKPWESKGLTPVTLDFKTELGNLVIAENGKAKVSIVTVKTADWFYPQIAQLLKTHLDKCTGANFKIITGGVPVGKHIFIGPVNEPTVQKVHAQAQEGKLDSLQIVSFEKGIILTGRDCLSPYANQPPRRLNIHSQEISRGSVNAVVDFLERLVGMRWYHWGQLGECAPDFTQKALNIPPVSYKDAPVFYERRSTHGNLPTPYGQDAPYMPEKYRVGKRPRNQWRTALTRASGVHKNIANHTDTKWHEVMILIDLGNTCLIKALLVGTHVYFD